MAQAIRQSLLVYVILTVITGLVYPLVITATAQMAWPDKANGSLIVDTKSGTVMGSSLIGQEFSEPSYFWGRLSGTSPAYNAGASSGTNYGPLNENRLKNARDRIDALRQSGTADGAVPVDLVTASASGLDPHISVASARFQRQRVAAARGLSERTVEALIDQFTEGKDFGCLGEPRINVLKLNIALDQIGRPAAFKSSGGQL